MGGRLWGVGSRHNVCIQSLWWRTVGNSQDLKMYDRVWGFSLDGTMVSLVFVR